MKIIYFLQQQKRSNYRVCIEILQFAVIIEHSNYSVCIDILQFTVITYYQSSTSGVFLTRVDLRTIGSSGSTFNWGRGSGWTTGSIWRCLSFVTISSLGSKSSLSSDDSLHSDPLGTRILCSDDSLHSDPLVTRILCSDDSLHSDPLGTRSLLKNEELRVTFCPWLVLAVIMLPFLATIVIWRDSYGAWAFDAVNGLLTRTGSPTSRSHGLTYLFRSAWYFIFHFCSTSRFRTISATGSAHVDCGSLLWTARFKNSVDGATPVVELGVVRCYGVVYACISFLQFLPSDLAAFTHFFIVFTNLSTSPLALGHNGVTFRCFNPNTSAKLAKSCPLNGGPLSDFTTFGVPNVANILSSFGLHDIVHQCWCHDWCYELLECPRLRLQPFFGISRPRMISQSSVVCIDTNRHESRTSLDVSNPRGAETDDSLG